VSLSRYHTYYLTGLVLIYNQLGLTCYAYVRYRLFCFVFVTSNEVQNIFTVDALKMGVWRAFMKEEFKWRTMKTGNVKGNQRLKHWASDYPVFERELAYAQHKTMWPGSHRIIVMLFAQEAGNAVGDRAKHSGSRAVVGRARAADRAVQNYVVWLSTDSRYSKAAVTLCQKGILVQRKRVPCRWAVSFPDENVFTTDGKGICRSSWRKWMRYPRRLRVPSLNKIAQTAVRPSPLWEFRAANCFRDLIAKLQNENPRRTAFV